MAQQYMFVRMPRKTYDEYMRIKQSMEFDLKKLTGKKISIPMTKVMHAIVSPEFKENFIKINLKNLMGFAKKRQW